MMSLSPRSLAKATAICLASTSFSFSDTTAAEKATENKPSGITNVVAKDGLLGTCGNTKFALQREGVRQYLMATNGTETCKLICKVAPGSTFSATQVSEKPEVFNLSIGEDKYALIWFAGGSLAPATN